MYAGNICIIGLLAIVYKSVAFTIFRSSGSNVFGPVRVGNRYCVSMRADATAAGIIEGAVRPAPVKATAHDLYTGRDPARVKIFDTTLRDGEQSPGCAMNTEEKLLVAAQLAKLGVDVIEAGFPIASDGDFEAVSKIAMSVGNLENPPIICGLARALKKDISRCYDAVKHAKFPRIHTFIATSDIHMEHKLKKTRAEVLEITKEMVSHAASLCKDIEFSAEDALRSDADFLYEVYSVAIAAGATTINVPDTVGYTTPAEFYRLIKGIRENVKGVDTVTISVHGHNDLGMAVANFLAAVEGGARQLECTINGIGERAGNAALEELVMALHVRKSYFNRFFSRPDESDVALTHVNSKEIYKSSRLVSTITGMQVQANKAIVGANAFSHLSGIHQDGMLKNKRTYEIMDAESIGALLPVDHNHPAPSLFLTLSVLHSTRFYRLSAQASPTTALCWASIPAATPFASAFPSSATPCQTTT